MYEDVKKAEDSLLGRLAFVSDLVPCSKVWDNYEALKHRGWDPKARAERGRRMFKV